MKYKVFDIKGAKYAYTIDTGDIILKLGDAIIIHTGTEYESATIEYIQGNMMYVADRWEYSKIFNKYPDKSIEEYEGIKKIKEEI